MMNVVLDWQEVTTAAQIGIRRNVSALVKNRQNTKGGDHDEHWDQHVRGALGECAVAKAVNQYWQPFIGRVDAVDLGNLEIRTTKVPNGRLIIRKEDSAEANWVFVRGHFRHLDGLHYEIVGWIKGVDGKTEENWADPTGKNRPAYFVKPGYPGWHDINGPEDFPATKEETTDAS